MITDVGNKLRLSVFLRDKKKILFDGLAKSVTSHNTKGEFDILPQHANFISLIKNSIQIVPDGGNVLKVDIDHGILRVVADKVEIYVEE